MRGVDVELQGWESGLHLWRKDRSMWRGSALTFAFQFEFGVHDFGYGEGTAIKCVEACRAAIQEVMNEEFEEHLIELKKKKGTAQ